MATRRERRSKPKKRKRYLETPKVRREEPKGFYHTNYKKLLIIPFIMLLLAFGQLGYQYATTGDFLNKGVSLTGGLTLTIPVEEAVDTDAIQQVLAGNFPGTDIIVRGVSEFGEQQAVMVEAEARTGDEAAVEALEEEMLSVLRGEISFDDYSVEIIGPSLGASFFVQTVKAVVIAFLLMGIVIFFYFGENSYAKAAGALLTLIAAVIIFQSGGAMLVVGGLLVLALAVLYVLYSPPSAAVILAALSDIVVTLAVVNMLGIKLSTAGIAAFLMLIGYSVDTDILLSVRVLKRAGGTVQQRLNSALKTGIMMASTSIVAAIIALMVAQSETIHQIMLIILIGLVVDVINTWLQNAGIIRLYAEKRGLQ